MMFSAAGYPDPPFPRAMGGLPRYGVARIWCHAEGNAWFGQGHPPAAEPLPLTARSSTR